MRESFSLFLWNKKVPHQNNKLRIRYYLKIFFKKYDNVPIWKMIIFDTWYDIKRCLNKF